MCRFDALGVEADQSCVYSIYSERINDLDIKSAQNMHITQQQQKSLIFYDVLVFASQSHIDSKSLSFDLFNSLGISYTCVALISLSTRKVFVHFDVKIYNWHVWILSICGMCIFMHFGIRIIHFGFSCSFGSGEVIKPAKSVHVWHKKSSNKKPNFLLFSLNKNATSNV